MLAAARRWAVSASSSQARLAARRRRRIETALTAGKGRPAQMLGHLPVEAAFQQAIEGMRIHAPLPHAGADIVKE
jgi:hypothetical protein